MLLTVFTAAGRSAAQPAQIIVLRHAEKPDDPASVHLSSAGERRAEALVPFLTTDPVLTAHGLPVALYSTPVRATGHGQRSPETIRPLSQALHLPIQAPFAAAGCELLAHSILSNRDYRNKTVLICWTHEKIPGLIAALGVHPPPAKLGDDVYDRIYVITFHRGKPTLKDLPQVLSMGSGATRLSR